MHNVFDNVLIHFQGEKKFNFLCIDSVTQPKVGDYCQHQFMNLGSSQSIYIIHGHTYTRGGACMVARIDYSMRV